MEKIESLVVAAAGGDKTAYEQIVRRFQDMAYGCAYSNLRDFDLAQDAAQEAFIEAWQNLMNLRDPAAFPGWFRRIVQYQCSALTRGRKVTTVPLEHASKIPAPRPTPAEAMEKREMADKVLEAVDSLPQPQREVTTLFYINGYSQDEIADFLEVPVGTVKSRLHASRKRLKEEMMDMVKRSFNDHKLPDDFAGKVIEGVPVLAWDISGNSTDIAGVAAALSVIDPRYDYDTLMVYTGLAFRLRNVRRRDGSGWNAGIGPIGKFEEESEAICLATGMEEFNINLHTGTIDEMRRRIVAEIDARRCPNAWVYGDYGVIYGYEDDGATVLVRSYELGEGFHRVSLEKMIMSPGGHPGLFFLEPKHYPLPEKDALIMGLRMGVRNWFRGRQPGERWGGWCGKGVLEFTFGCMAYDLWIEDLERIESLPKEKWFYGDHTWIAYHLYDARLCGARVLSARSGVLGEKARPHLEAAAKHLDNLGSMILGLRRGGEAFDGEEHGLKGRQLEDWTPEVRRKEIEALREARDLDWAAIGEIEKALFAAGGNKPLPWPKSYFPCFRTGWY